MSGPPVIGGLVLAAGAGTRFGARPKQLAELHGRPLLQWAVNAQLGVPAVDPVVVVLGARAAEIRAAVDFGDARVVVCDEWETGQSASLRRGLDELPEVDAVLVTLGDAPLVTPQVIARMVDEVDRPGPARAAYRGDPGHPVILKPAQIEALAHATGDAGARGLLRDARTIEVGHLCSGRDVDTPEDLEEVRNEARAVI
jgi:CTP:molybdopterin cytidylyltransferase MocA